MRRICIVLVAVGMTAGTQTAAAQAHDHDHASPYADDRSHVAALSGEEVRQLREGEGMGFARAAELNSYPGPKHLLEMADALALTAAQRTSIEEIRSRMLESARALGSAIIEAEEALDARFVEGSVNPDLLLRSVLAITETRGRLRVVHLNAHLESRKLLRAEQVDRYDRMRGYR